MAWEAPTYRLLTVVPNLVASLNNVPIQKWGKCCFHANRSWILQNKIKKLQEDLERRRRESQDNPLWTGFHGLLPYILPLLGPFFFSFS